MKGRRARHRVFRPGFAGAVKVALSIVLAIELVYLLAANLVLFRWLRSWINTDEQALRLEYEGAWSPWPGRVYARNLRLRVQDSNIQFELRTDTVEVDIVLTSLLRRTFRATHLDVEGLKFKFRHKLQELPQNPRMVRALPPIEGFADPPLMKKTPSEPSGKLWTIHITDVDARIEELWIQQFRSLGRARAWGGFRLEPTRRLWVKPGGLALDPGPLNAGEKELVASDFGGRIDATVDEMDLQQLHGWQVFSRISTHVGLKADLVDLDFLQMFLEPERIRVAKGGGPLRIDVRLTRGVLQAPSTVTYTSARVELHSKGSRVFGDARVDLTVPEPDRGRLSIAATEIGFDATSEKSQGTPILIKRPRIELETRTLALHQTLKASGGRLDVPELVAPDLRTLALVLAGKTRLAGGPLTGRARARLDQHGSVAGQVDLDFRDARVMTDGVSVSATGRFETALFAPDVLGTNGELRNVVLEIERGFLRTQDGSTGPGALEARAERIPYSDFVPKQIVAAIHARFADARPVLKALGIEPTGLAAAAAALVDLSDLEIAARAKLEGKTVDVQLLRARTDMVRARGRYRRVGGTERGAFLLITDLVNVGLEISDGDTTVHPLASESWLDRALADLRLGSIASSDREPIGPRPAPARMLR
jgi:hypothetical protein